LLWNDTKLCTQVKQTRCSLSILHFARGISKFNQMYPFPLLLWNVPIDNNNKSFRQYLNSITGDQ